MSKNKNFIKNDIIKQLSKKDEVFVYKKLNYHIEIVKILNKHSEGRSLMYTYESLLFHSKSSYHLNANGFFYKRYVDHFSFCPTTVREAFKELFKVEGEFRIIYGSSMGKSHFSKGRLTPFNEFMTNRTDLSF